MSRRCRPKPKPPGGVAVLKRTEKRGKVTIRLHPPETEALWARES